LNQGIRFTQIAELVERVLNQTQVSGVMSLDGILEADKVARQHAQIMVKGLNA
jgi:1-deoxy-D-xylulose-5-phosphate reductoisomerase